MAENQNEKPVTEETDAPEVVAHSEAEDAPGCGVHIIIGEE
ncbi:hypothetical protein [Kitasatospora sp. MAP5-34]|nr:hypothetical protein [Kitasatospora sp. MAP5-34]MDH6579921.1 hypothetical protein [Kitasatospora sp. MAP5-34]